MQTNAAPHLKPEGPSLERGPFHEQGVGRSGGDNGERLHIDIVSGLGTGSDDKCQSAAQKDVCGVGFRAFYGLITFARTAVASF